MRTSQFQFSNPVLTNLRFIINNTYEKKNENINVNINLNIEKKRINNNEAEVELTIEIGEKTEKMPFHIVATEGAMFKWADESFSSDEEIDKLLNINAPALLLSYLRPIISTVTAASKYPAYNIPFINFNTKNEAK